MKESFAVRSWRYKQAWRIIRSMIRLMRMRTNTIEIYRAKAESYVRTVTFNHICVKYFG